MDLLQALIKKKQRQMSSSNLVTVGQRHGDVPWYTCKLQENLVRQHVPRSAERWELEIAQDAAVEVRAPWMVKTMLIETIRREAWPSHQSVWGRRTFRDYNQVGASLRDSPIHRETWSKEVREFTTPQGFGRMGVSYFYSGSYGQQPR